MRNTAWGVAGLREGETSVGIGCTVNACPREVVGVEMSAGTTAETGSEASPDHFTGR